MTETNVVPIKVHRGIHRKTLPGNGAPPIEPEEVQAWFTEAGRGKRCKVPAVDTCGRLADTLTMMRCLGDPVTVAMDLGAAGPLLTALPDVLEEPVSRLRLYAERGSNTPSEALERIRRLREDARWLITNLQPLPVHSWHKDACLIADLAFHAWDTCCKPPVATDAAGPLVTFVTRALAETGRARSASAVSSALRGLRGRK